MTSAKEVASTIEEYESKLNEADPWRVQLVNRRWLTVGPSRRDLPVARRRALRPVEPT